QATNSHGYALQGGSLSVNKLSITKGAAFPHSGGVINHAGLLTLAAGHWQARPATQTLGRLRLANYSNQANSTIDFPAGPSVLRLANSSGEPWSPTANLFINNWHGSASGGGQTQLYFGSNATGLTSPQLARINFSVSGR